MTLNRVIHSKYKSSCCQALQQLVRSRPNNFIAQDCIACKVRARLVRLDEIPQAQCTSCSDLLDVVYMGNNYGYKCAACVKEFELGSILPLWTDGFEYCGVATPNEYAR